MRAVRNCRRFTAPLTLDEASAALSMPRPLPGDRARTAMIPEYRIGEQPWAEPDAWKDAAVLVLLYPEDGQVRFPLMLRPPNQGVHSDQISLPGGSRENGEPLESCALRETAEELGVAPSGIRIIRSLSPMYITPSRFLVQPYIGVAETRPDFQPSPSEVAALIETSLTELLDPGIHMVGSLELRGRTWRVPYYRLAGYKVWGATAMILAELEALLRGE
jgi:8-oxo-dGTP pyrophosphatase MutT (NUDIX family)